PSQCSCSGTDVKCDWRQLASVPARIPTTTQRLWLNNNQITKLDPGVFDSLRALELLNTYYYEFTCFSWVFNSLTQLTHLDLGGNQLKALAEGMFDRLGNLQWLGLHVNQLKSVPRGA
uniref:LRRNT domain-containing protein n=1 Tax=Petromyzon marinus TaxID=7757 RepID=S4RV20_PETMA